MGLDVRGIDYFYTQVEDTPGAAFRLLEQLAELNVNLLAFTAIPTGPMRVQLTLFPEDAASFEAAAGRAGLKLDGPYRALLAHGDDRLGVLAEIHGRLARAGVNVFASNGVSDGKGHFGYVVYVRHDQYEDAERALGI